MIDERVIRLPAEPLGEAKLLCGCACVFAAESHLRKDDDGGLTYVTQATCVYVPCTAHETPEILAAVRAAAESADPDRFAGMSRAVALAAIVKKVVE